MLSDPFPKPGDPAWAYLTMRNVVGDLMNEHITRSALGRIWWLCKDYLLEMDDTATEFTPEDTVRAVVAMKLKLDERQLFYEANGGDSAGGNVPGGSDSGSVASGG